MKRLCPFLLWLVIVGFGNLPVQAQNPTTVQKLISEFRAKLRQVDRKLNIDSQKVILRTKYSNDLALLVGYNQAQTLVQEAEIAEIATNGSIKYLRVDRQTKLEMARLKYLRDMEEANLNRKQLPWKEKKIAKTQLVNTYKANVLRLLGPQEYEHWVELVNPPFEVICKRKFKLSAEQITRLKEVENKRAIATYQLTRKRLPTHERRMKIMEIKREAANEAKKFLTATQFRKWCEYRNIDYK